MRADQSQSINCEEFTSAKFVFGSTPGMRGLKERIDEASRDDLPVLIEGENGTGKELIGRYLHSRSARRRGPFIKVNCSALSAVLLENEMFGYEPVREDRSNEVRYGSMDMAAGGTLFFDEIGETDLVLQEKLARIMQTKRYRRQGSREELTLDARFVCASGIDPQKLDRDGEIAPEILAQLGHRFRLLPLRERKRDIPEICEFLAQKFACNFGRPVPHLSPSVLHAFEKWDWPGNVRELENWMARIVIFGTEEAIGLEFSRQLRAWMETAPRVHRTTFAKAGRIRRARRPN